ncbi:MAG: TonB-dependent receptor, partial [Myxococcales bacterium]|nr:TonB-dependent receptor [Myxococcales bacterium]
DVEAAILAAVEKLRFAPATRAGKPIPARIRFRFAIAVTEPETESESDTATETETASATETAAESESETGVVDEEQDEEVVMRAEAVVDRPAPGAATQVRLRAEELTVVPGTFGEPLRVVATLPGVARTPFGLGFFAVRGASLQNTGFLVDGFPVPLLYHLGAGPAIISSRLVERLDFYPGGYPLAFGRYNAGIISLGTAPPPTDRFQLEFEVDLLRASALTIVPIEQGRGSLAVAFRRSYYDLILPLITDDVTLFYADYQVRLDYRLSERLKLSLFFFGSRDSLQFSQEVGAGETLGQTSGGLTYDFDRLITSLEYRPIGELKLRWSATAGPSSIDFGRESTTDSALGVDTSSLRLGQRLEAIYVPTEHLQTTVGIEENIWINELEGQAPSFGELPSIPAPANDRASIEIADRLSELTVAPYLEQVVRPGPFEITSGVRAEYYRYGDVSTWVGEPRGVVRMKVTPDVTLKAATGLFSQAPLPFQVNRSFGNPRLDPNRAWQSSVGTELKLPATLEVDTTLFYSRMWQLSRASGRPSVDDEGNPVTLFFEDDGEGRAFGWELLVRRKVEEGLFGWLSYTLSRSERFTEGGRTVVFFFDQTHVLNLAASYKVGDWRFGGRFTLTSGRPTNDLRANEDGSNVVYDTDEDDFEVENRGARVRLPTFHQFDVRVDYDLALGPFDGSLFLDVINVYNAPNAEGYTYEYDFSERGRIPGLPFLPTIGIRGVLR